MFKKRQDNGQHPRSSERSVLSRWGRAWTYAFFWLPSLGLLFWFAPRFGPIFQKLDEKGELPVLSSWVWAFVRLNDACFYLPAVILVLVHFALGEVVFAARRPPHGQATWITVVLCIGFIEGIVIVLAVLLAVFRYPLVS